MPLFATNAAALFEPRDSPLSQVELLARDAGQYSGRRRGNWSREDSDVKDVTETRTGSEETLRDVSAGREAASNKPTTHLIASQRHDVSPQWVSLKSPEQIKCHLSTENQFRAIVIRQQNSHSRLSVSKDLFESVSSNCGLPTQFEDVLTYFGSRDLEVEVASPRLRFARPSQRLSSASRNGFECTYALRFVEMNHRGNPRRVYSLRQMAVCHKEEPDVNSTTWALVAPPPTVMLAFSERVGNQETTFQDQPFNVHLLFFNFAVSSWRPYLVHLAQELHQHANTVLVAAPNGIGPISLSRCGDPQRLQQLGDELLDTTVALSTTRDAVSRLAEGYKYYVTRIDAQENTVIDENGDDVYHELMEHLREVDWLLQQTDGLRQKLLGTSQLVSSFMALGNGHSLEDLGKEAKEENYQIHELAKKSTQDAAAVKVLTIMMLVYLPATVVSNFFSTSFVDNNGPPGSPRRLIVLSNWWLFVVISIPLTLVTLYVWWVCTGVQATGTYPWWWEKIERINFSFRRKKAVPADEESKIGRTSTAATMEVAREKL